MKLKIYYIFVFKPSFNVSRKESFTLGTKWPTFPNFSYSGEIKISVFDVKEHVSVLLTVVEKRVCVSLEPSIIAFRVAIMIGVFISEKC